MTQSHVATCTVIMEAFLKRSGLRFKRTNSDVAGSVYFDIFGGRRPYRLRIADHDECAAARADNRRADFHIRSIDGIRAAQTSIEALVSRTKNRRLATGA
jgi:hypothetical protein